MIAVRVKHRIEAFREVSVAGDFTTEYAGLQYPTLHRAVAASTPVRLCEWPMAQGATHIETTSHTRSLALRAQ